ncbi:metallophosphoesterase family protein [Nitratireductor pacificus]|uniref:Metallophosphoesterase n=1 Tax=Nitratireductor pacificus pht-3B TaxID=391937 RepID=K2M5H9_9HYPH|nr:metallophosphoesterase [Nitratireductor pacificus]EKF17406.1 metallophosphoesterase [Nitratireductor pacificus pht-3B]
MFRLAHFSDIHLGPLPAISYRELASKRITGYINWKRNRRLNLDHGVIDRITDDMLAADPDHIALTGDLVNLALDKEIERAALWLEDLGPADAVSVVPGNHDAYVPGALARACRAWKPYMTGDGGEASRVGFPYLRVRGQVAIIGVSSARATAPFMASGHFSASQAKRLAAILDATGRDGLFRVVMIHHPPVRGATHTAKRLYGIGRFQKLIRRHGAELVLHGHTHKPTVHRIAGSEGTSVPVVGVSAAGQAHGGAKPAAHYNLFDIDGGSGQWRIRFSRRGITDGNGTVGEVSGALLTDEAQAG